MSALNKTKIDTQNREFQDRRKSDCLFKKTVNLSIWNIYK